MQYYNVVNAYKTTSGVSKAVARILNALIHTINAEQKLPRFLVIILDKDLLSDINVFDGYAARAITNSVDWLVKQIHVVISQKKSELLVKRPGAVFTGDPKIIFIHMLRHCERYVPGSKLDLLFDRSQNTVLLASTQADI